MFKTSIAMLLLLSLVLLPAAATADKKGKKAKKAKDTEDPYAEYVWPPPPDEARIKLEAVIHGRIDVEGDSKMRRILLGAGPQSPYDLFKKPFAVAIDSQNRFLVTDSQTGALLRFDLTDGIMDVLGTQGRIRLKLPLGLDIGHDDIIYVADPALGQIVAFEPEGEIHAQYGQAGDLNNPTDGAVSPDNKQLFVTDSKAHQIVVFGIEDGDVVTRIGRRGEGDGEFNFPSALTFGPEGNLFVVDQMNSRIQVLDPTGEYLDQFGALGVGFADFVRPKDIAVDETGFIYVTDNAFNNIQIFDIDFTLLTFVGAGGQDPGRFHGVSGVAVRHNSMAAVDQLGRRLQVFHLIGAKTAQ